MLSEQFSLSCKIRLSLKLNGEHQTRKLCVSQNLISQMV